MGQLKISFPWEIDREATRQAVEERLESARIYKQIGFVRREMKNTSSPEPRYHGPTNAISKPAEDVAVWNVDTEAWMQQQQEQVERAIARLGRTERQIIEMRYLEDDEVYDYNVYNEIGMGSTKYYEVKSRALYKLAFALRLEVYIQPNEETA